jgi:uncharacterized surface protein with fasciclin (FAS1) repeats
VSVLKVLLAISAWAVFVSAAAQSPPLGDPVVGGAPMFPYRSIIRNAERSADHTTLVAAVRAAGLSETLDGPGPLTVFAPTDQAFAKLPAGAVSSLLQPRNHQALVNLLTYHVVSGKLTAARIRSAIKAGGGQATFTTVQGQPLTASLYEDRITLTDAKGGRAVITIGNVMQSNGLIHVIDGVLTP